MSKKVKSLQKRLRKASGSAGSLNALKAAKYILSLFYSKDAFLLLKRYDLVKNSLYMETDKNFRAKAFVDLLMSIESSLKSIYIALSEDSMDLLKTYKEARKSSHDISELFEKCKKLADGKYHIFNKNPKEFSDIKILRVDVRYSLDMWCLVYLESIETLLMEEDILSRTIESSQWFESLHALAKHFYAVQDEIRTDRLSGYKTTTGVTMIECGNLLTVFIKDSHFPSLKDSHLNLPFFL